MQTPTRPGPSDVAALLSLLQREPGRPRITWYGPDGERVELSGAVLANWVAKTTNLLVEEFDVGPGTRVRLDLPPHWRTLTWALSTWRAGACVVTGGDDEGTDDVDTDVVVTDSPERHPGTPELVVVALPALARRFEGTVPDGAIDGAAAVMTYGDTLGWTPPVDPAACALSDLAGRTVTHGDLFPSTGAGQRVAARTATTTATPVVDLALLAITTWSADGSLVLTDASLPAATVERALTDEHVTSRRH